MAKIYCRHNHSNLDFFIADRGKEYFLFTQKWHRGIEEYFKHGVALDRAINHSKSRSDRMIHKVKSKLPMQIRYIEKEYGIAFLEQSKRRLAAA